MRALEGDLFSLAECWGWTFEESLKIPSDRRKRALRWKQRLGDLMQERAKRKPPDDGPIKFSADDLKFIWADDPLSVLW